MPVKFLGRPNRFAWHTLNIQDQRLQQELDAENQRQDRNHHSTGGGGDARSQRSPPMPGAPGCPKHAGHEPHEKEQGYGREVANEVLNQDPSNKSDEQQWRELEKSLAFRQMTDFVSVARGQIHISYTARCSPNSINKLV